MVRGVCTPLSHFSQISFACTFIQSLSIRRCALEVVVESSTKPGNSSGTRSVSRRLAGGCTAGFRANPHATDCPLCPPSNRPGAVPRSRIALRYGIRPTRPFKSITENVQFITKKIKLGCMPAPEILLLDNTRSFRTSYATHQCPTRRVRATLLPKYFLKRRNLSPHLFFSVIIHLVRTSDTVSKIYRERVVFYRQIGSGARW